MRHGSASAQQQDCNKLLLFFLPRAVCAAAYREYHTQYRKVRRKIMKTPLKKLTLIAAAVSVAAMATTPVLARGGHGGGHGGSRDGHFHGGPRVSVGIALGAPLLRPWYAPPPYYYYPPAVAVPYSPPVYVERGPADSAAAAPSQNYWYYCAESQTYFPYGAGCAGAWQPVTPQPPSS